MCLPSQSLTCHLCTPMVLPSLQQSRDLITPWQASKAGGSEVASEAPLSDRPARDRHQLRTLLLAIAILSTVLLAAFLAIGAATWLHPYGFLHFPLGVYLLAQGLLIFIVVATFWFIRLQDRLDQTRSENEELGCAWRFPARPRTSTPHLGAYYGIITSAFVSICLCVSCFSELGVRQTLLAEIMLLAPLALYLLIAVGSRTLNVEDFFCSGRRVPPLFNGFVLAATAVGGVGVLAYTGTVFFLGFDALAIGLGWTAGMLIGGVLFVPYLRKAGSYTLPTFFGHRFRSRTVRMTVGVMLLPPAALLLAAEMKVAALIAVLFLPVSFSLSVIMIAVLIAITAILGGMRSVTWTGSAEFIVGAIGLVVVVTTVSIMLTNIPAPQLTYAEMLSPLHDAEITAGLTPVQPDVAASPSPAPPPTASSKPFQQSFGSLRELDFATLFLCLALGTASLPSLLTRSGVTRSISDQRRSTAWGVMLVALFVMTAPAMAAFAKLILFKGITLAPASDLPSWFTALSQQHLIQAGDANGDGAIGAQELLVPRDGIALALPAAAELPYVLSVVMAAAAIAIALSA